MYKTTMILIALIMTTSAVFADANIDLQMGLTQFYSESGSYGSSGISERGYRGDINTTIPFDNWDIALDVRCLGFPGSDNAFTYYTDFVASFYFSEGDIKPYFAPVIGYSHSRMKLGRNDEKLQYDFYRFGGKFGLKSTFGNKYLDICFGLIAETPTWKEDDSDYTSAFPEDFYLENEIQAEFGWTINKHFGITTKLSGLSSNFIVDIFNNNVTGTEYMPSIQIGPSLYL